jgi:D-alanine-D-alanine ligase
MHKPSFKRLLDAHGIPTLPFSEIPVDSPYSLDHDVTRVIDERGGGTSFPLFVKPVAEGSSLGTAMVTNPDELRAAVAANRRDGYGDTMVEPFVHARSFTVGLLEIDRKLVVLPPVEIKPLDAFHSVREKSISRADKFDCPAKVSDDVSAALQRLAYETHRAVGAHGLSRVDFLMGDDGALYVGEINTLPALRRTATVPLMAQVYGLSYDQLIRQVLQTAFTRPR